MKQFHRPLDAPEALRLRADLPESAYLAGGTETHARRESPPHLVSLEKLGLEFLERSDETLRIGALATLTDLVDSPWLSASPWRALAQAASHVTNRNIRNQATVGGNLAANKSCSDLIPALLILDAVCVVHEPAGPRTMPLTEFQALPAGQKPLLLEVHVPHFGPAARIALRRFARTANDLAIVNVAVRADAANRFEKVKVALGGLGPQVIRATPLDAALENFPVGKPPDTLAKDVVAALLASVHPIDDQRGSADFKTKIAGALLLEALREIACGGSL